MFVLANNFNKYQSIYSIKQQLKLQDYFFMCESRILDDNKCIAHYGLKPNSKIEIKKKSKGGSATAGYVLKVILFVLLFLIFYFLLIVGVLPFISFIASNILIKALKMAINWLRSLTDPNNWLNSALHMVQIVIIPFFQFLLEYAGMAVIVFFLTFFCTYKLYYFANTKKDDSIENQCKAFKATNMLAGLTTFFVCLFYFIANLPILLATYVTPLIPNPLRNPVKEGIIKFGDLREKLLASMGPMGAIEERLINALQFFFEKADNLKDMDAQLLYNWAQTYKMTKMYPMNEYIQEAKLTELLEDVNFADLNQKGEFDKERSCLTQRQASFAYLLRSTYDNGLYIMLKLIGILDICGNQQPYIEDLEEQKKRMETMQTTIQNVINKAKNKNNKSANRKSVEEIAGQIAKLQQLIEKAKGTKLLNVPCLVNILVNGALFSIFIFIIFTILFIVLFFVQF